MDDAKRRTASALPPKELRVRIQDPFQALDNVAVSSSVPSDEQLAALHKRQALAHEEWKAKMNADAKRRERVLFMKGSMNRPGC